MNTPMTPAQAAQQSNRDDGGRYQSKTHAEAEVELETPERTARQSLGELTRTILADSESDHPDDPYTLNVHEARTLARAVERALALADRLDHEAQARRAAGQDPFEVMTIRQEATRIRTALNGK